MKVFISWSGDRGRQIGEAIREWLPWVLQSVDVHFSPNDIDKGAQWVSELANALSASSVGIIIMTQEGLGSDWVMFEAGAIAGRVDKARVCPLLFDVKKSDLKWPLAAFNAADFTKEEVRKVVTTVNKAQDKALPDDKLAKAFEKWWPDLDETVNRILASTPSTDPAPQPRSPTDLMEEVLVLTRTLLTRQGETTDTLVKLLGLQPSPPVWPGVWSHPSTTEADVRRMINALLNYDITPKEDAKENSSPPARDDVRHDEDGGEDRPAIAPSPAPAARGETRRSRRGARRR